MTRRAAQSAPSPRRLIAYVRRYLEAYVQAIDSICDDDAEAHLLIRQAREVLDDAEAMCALAATRRHDMSVLRGLIQSGFDVAMTSEDLREAAQSLGDLPYNAIGHFAAHETVPADLIEHLLDDPSFAPFAIRLLGLSRAC